MAGLALAPGILEMPPLEGHCFPQVFISAAAEGNAGISLPSSPEPWISPTMWGWAPGSGSLLSSHPGAMSQEETLSFMSCSRVSVTDFRKIEMPWTDSVGVFPSELSYTLKALWKNPHLKKKWDIPKTFKADSTSQCRDKLNIWPQDFQQKWQPKNLRYGHAGIHSTAGKQKFLHSLIAKTTNQLKILKRLHAMNN